MVKPGAKVAKIFGIMRLFMKEFAEIKINLSAVQYFRRSGVI